MHSDSCECIVWRHGVLRCELWAIGGLGVLKVFEGVVLTRQESFQSGTWYHRAQELRRLAISDSLHP
jgi:hypothetical protein